MNMKQKTKKKTRKCQKISAVNNRNNRNTNRCFFFHWEAALTKGRRSKERGAYFRVRKTSHIKLGNFIFF